MCNIIWYLECGYWQAIKYLWFCQINFNHVKPFTVRRMSVFDAREETASIKVNSPHKGQWNGALMFSLICAWLNGSINNREAGDLRHHRDHYDVTVMWDEVRWDKSKWNTMRWGDMRWNSRYDERQQFIFSFKIKQTGVFTPNPWRHLSNVNV